MKAKLNIAARHKFVSVLFNLMLPKIIQKLWQTSNTCQFKQYGVTEPTTEIHFALVYKSSIHAKGNILRYYTTSTYSMQAVHMWYEINLILD